MSGEVSEAPVDFGLASGGADDEGPRNALWKAIGEKRRESIGVLPLRPGAGIGDHANVYQLGGSMT